MEARLRNSTPDAISILEREEMRQITMLNPNNFGLEECSMHISLVGIGEPQRNDEFCKEIFACLKHGNLPEEPEQIAKKNHF
jgi:hypothetical protein